MFDYMQENDTDQKRSDIKAEIAQQVMMSCSCTFTANNITDDTFSCRGSQGEFSNTVVYRAMITLQVSASITDADNIVAIISNWVMSEPSVAVDGITLQIDPDCPTMLDSFSSSDCVFNQTTSVTDQTTSSSSSSSTVVIIGVVVAAVVIILILIITIVIMAVYYKRKSSYR